MDVNIDKECIDLCKAMNKFEGIQTIESCCGHGETPYHIWFKVENLEKLPALLYWFDGCHTGFYDWAVKVKTDCAYQYPTFYVEGPIGQEAYDQSKEIAEHLLVESKQPTECYR